MARQVTAQIRLQVTGGQATPAPPVGPALGQHGVNIGQFVSQFNDRTKDMRGITVPVVITVYSDRSFTFEIKSPPAAVLLKQAAGIPLEKKKGGEVINPDPEGDTTYSTKDLPADAPRVEFVDAFVCDKCGQAFATEALLNVHRRTAHRPRA